MKLKHILNEINVKITGISDVWLPLYTSAILFYMKRLNITSQIAVGFFKSKKTNNLFGHVNPKNPTKLKIEATTPKLILKSIAHEITHSKQFLNNQLSVDNNNMYWEGKFSITVDEYLKFTEYNDKYKNLPFEKESFSNQEILTNEFLLSKDYIAAMKSNPTLQYIKDNNLL